MSTARLLVLDIETYRTRNTKILERLRADAYKKEPAKNARKELKTQWNTTEAREARAKEAIDKTAVDPLIAELICCCWAADELPPQFSAYEKERDTLIETRVLLNEQTEAETIWIGHNIMGFDLPVLLNRWRAYDIQPPYHFPTFINGHWRGRVFDTMRRTPCKNGLGLVSLADVCDAYGIEGAKEMVWNGEPMSGKRVGAAYDAREYDLILNYCADDVQVERKLYLRMTGNDTRDTYDTRDAVREKLREIDDSGHDDGVKALAKMAVLKNAGLVPSH